MGGRESERAFFGSGGGKGKGREKTAAGAELLAAEREFLALFFAPLTSARARAFVCRRINIISAKQALRLH